MGRRAPGRSAGLLAGVSLAVAMAACSGHDAGSSTAAGASCAAVIVHRGHYYLGTHVDRPVPTTRPLGRGTIPPCQDTGPTTASGPGTRHRILALPGIDPAEAVVVAGYRRNVWIRMRGDSLGSGTVRPSPALRHLLARLRQPASRRQRAITR